MKTTLYNQEGKKLKEIEISDALFGVKSNKDAIHQAMTSLRSRARSGNANTKGRSEVRGGGKKPWKQKGTGRARHGSRRSPIWVGGGITHGPKSEKNYDRKINSNTLKKVLAMAFSAKFKSGNVVFVDEIKLKESKTKFAKSVFSNLSKIEGFESLARKNLPSTLLITPQLSKQTVLAFRNLPKTDILPMNQVSILDVLDHKNVLIINPEESEKVLNGRMAKKSRNKQK